MLDAGRDVIGAYYLNLVDMGKGKTALLDLHNGNKRRAGNGLQPNRRTIIDENARAVVALDYEGVRRYRCRPFIE